MVTHQLQVERKTAEVRRPETDVLPLCHADIFTVREYRARTGIGYWLTRRDSTTAEALECYHYSQPIAFRTSPLRTANDDPSGVSVRFYFLRRRVEMSATYMYYAVHHPRGVARGGPKGPRPLPTVKMSKKIKMLK